MSTQSAPGVVKEKSKHPMPDKGFLINRNFRLLAIGQAISIALAGYLRQFIPVYIIYATGGAFIALAGLFG